MRRLALALLLALAPADDGWLRVGDDLHLEYPRDHGEHPAYRTEWWYLTGQMQDDAGRAFGFQFTVFRSGLDAGPPAPGESPLRLRQAYVGQLALTDVEADRTRFAERLRRAGTPLATASPADLDLVLEDWTLARGPDDALALAAGDPAAGFALRFRLTPEKPLVLHGDHGVSRKGGDEGNASAYASWTRLALDGDVTLDGRPLHVRGAAWFDHEFGSSVLPEGVVGWDWFGLHLDDGRDLMLFVLRREDGGLEPASSATLVAPDGTSRTVPRDAFRVTSDATWESPRSGARYPARWRLEVPGEGLDLTLVPRVADCEWGGSEGATGVVYWEGPVAVEGDVTGRGYAELTGYAGSMKGRF